MKEGLVHVKTLRIGPDGSYDIEAFRIFYNSITGKYVWHWFCSDCGQDMRYLCFDADLADVVDEVECGYVCNVCYGDDGDDCLANMCQIGQGVPV